MRIAVVGSGAIGGATAAFMTLGGAPVTLVCRRPDTAALINGRGLRITGVRGDLCVRLPAVSPVAALGGGYDLIIVATKADAAPAAMAAALPCLAESGLVIGMQNGMCIDMQRAAAGAAAVTAVVSFAATLVGDGHIDLTGEGGYVIGMSAGGPDPRLEGARCALSAAFPATVTEDIFSAVYSKLIINSGITCGGVLTGQRLGRMLARAADRRFFTQTVREDMALAAALGITVPPFGGRLDYYRFIGAGPLYRHAVLAAVGARYAKLKSSSLTSLERGEKTEVRVLNGWISDRASALGVPAPVNAAVRTMVEEIEAGRRRPSPENIKEILKSIGE